MHGKWCDKVLVGVWIGQCISGTPAIVCGDLSNSQQQHCKLMG